MVHLYNKPITQRSNPKITKQFFLNVRNCIIGHRTCRHKPFFEKRESKWQEFSLKSTSGLVFFIEWKILYGRDTGYGENMEFI